MTEMAYPVADQPGIYVPEIINLKNDGISYYGLTAAYAPAFACNMAKWSENLAKFDQANCSAVQSGSICGMPAFKVTKQAADDTARIVQGTPLISGGYYCYSFFVASPGQVHFMARDESSDAGFSARAVFDTDACSVVSSSCSGMCDSMWATIMSEGQGVFRCFAGFRPLADFQTDNAGFGPYSSVSGVSSVFTGFQKSMGFRGPNPYERTGDLQVLRDFSGNGRNLTFGSSSTSVDTGDPLWTGNSLAFTDGLKRLYGPPLVKNPDEVTIMIVAKAGMESNYYSFFVQKESSPVEKGLIVQKAKDKPYYYMRIDTSLQKNACVSAYGSCNDEWNCVTFTAKKGTACAWLNAKLAHTMKYSHGDGFMSTANARMGSALFDFAYMLVYNRALNHAEIQKNYLAIRSRLFQRNIKLP